MLLDYIDLASQYSKIEVNRKMFKDNLTIYFNQDEIRAIKGVDPTKGIPIGIVNDGTVLYYTGNNDAITLSQYIINCIMLL